MLQVTLAAHSTQAKSSICSAHRVIILYFSKFFAASSVPYCQINKMPDCDCQRKSLTSRDCGKMRRKSEIYFKVVDFKATSGKVANN